MKIAIVGAGAIGGYLGTRLSIAGDDLTYIARKRNLEAIRTHGFRLLRADGPHEHAPGVRAVQTCAEAGPQDAVLITVKAHQVRDLLPDLRSLFGPQTAVVPMINGVPWWYFHKLGGPYEGRVLVSVDPFAVRASGYSFLEEMLCRVVRAGFRVGEVPIVFQDRTRGASKINRSEIYRAAWHVLVMALRGQRGSGAGPRGAR